MAATSIVRVWFVSMLGFGLGEAVEDEVCVGVGAEDEDGVGEEDCEGCGECVGEGCAVGVTTGEGDGVGVRGGIVGAGEATKSEGSINGD